ncbi:MAG: polyketide synthase dehydratase domain-containing protein [Parachlamydiaceae bacterium]|nr:polyketide synthase dehydratase domain-containing protein [Parachlamydiaceae bacterium]
MNSIGSLLDKLEKGEITIDDAIREIQYLKKIEKDHSPILFEEKYKYDESFLRDHQVNGQQVLIGATHASLAINRFMNANPRVQTILVHRLNYLKPIGLSKNETVILEVEIIHTSKNTHLEISAKSVFNLQKVLAATCQIEKGTEENNLLNISSLKQQLSPFNIERVYNENSTVVLGHSFKTIQELYVGKELALARITAYENDSHEYELSPYLINSPFLLITPILNQLGIKEAFLPLGIKRLYFHKPLNNHEYWIHLKVTKRNEELVEFDAEVADSSGRIFVQMVGCMIKRIRNQVEKNKLTKPEPNVRAMKKNSDLIIQVQDYLLDKVAKVLKVSTSKVDKSSNIMDAGLESIQLVKLAEEVEKEIKIELFPTVFFEYPSIKELSHFLAQEHQNSFADFLGHESMEFQTPVFDKEISIKTNPKPEHFKEEETSGHDIAIIGIAGQFPESKTPQDFWKNLLEKRDLIKEIPEDHWDYKEWFDPNPEGKDATYCKWGGFIEDIDKFDAAFFKISPRETEWIDPQLRLLIQNVYATAEDSGYVNQLRGTNTGVFVGVCSHDYVDRINQLGLPMNPFVGIGTTQTVFANRISFLFDLKGPSIAYDTACSSSLFALHAACVALRNKECDMAFVGGTNLLLSSEHYRYFSSIKALSPRGRCLSFDDSADGYVPAECVASILLKPLEKAKKDGDQIYGIIKGSAALHGGYTPSLTAPSIQGEENVIVKAWENAKINPETLSYIEAHGTGTKIGDPIEINALTSAFKKFTDKKGFCFVGSSKANMGHAEGAAGLVGIIKVILQMKNKIIPTMPNYKKLNSLINLNNSALQINHENINWNSESGPKRAGISSFGFSGAYAHVVLEEFVSPNKHEVAKSEYPIVFLFSAKTKKQLLEKAISFLEHIRERKYSFSELINVAYMLQVGREQMDERLGIIVRSFSELEEKLNLFIQSEQPSTQKYYLGTKENLNDTLALFENDQDLDDVLNKWMEQHKYERLLKLWVKGLTIDWKNLYTPTELSKIQKISLPSYPFAKQRFWLPKGDKVMSKAIPRVEKGEDFHEPKKLEITQKTISLSSLNSNVAITPKQEITRPSLPKAEIKIETNHLQELLRVSLAKVLFASPQDIQDDKNFNDLGLDSIISTEWIQMINSQWKVKLTSKSLYDYPTIQEFSAFLKSMLSNESATNEIIKPNDIHIRESDSLKNDLIETLSKTLYVSKEEIDHNKTFSDLGLDSILALEWIKAINTMLQTSFETKILYDYSSINKLADYLNTHKEGSIVNKPSHTVSVLEKKNSAPSFNEIITEFSPQKDEDIAIIALAGYYPEAENVDEFWANLQSGKDCIVEIPKERWNHSNYQNKIHGKNYCKWGGFIKNVDKFDPLFFNIAPREAEILDPNEKLFLQTTWNLLENGGYTRKHIKEKLNGLVGVFVGSMYQHYSHFQSDEVREAMTSISTYGGIANRTSHFFDFRGPSMAVDTMCSASGYALHLACESLKKGECKLAVVGGVNLSIHPKKYLALSQTKMLSSQNDRRSFSNGDGFIPGEAVSALLLKPLSAAKKDNDTILALIKSTSINHRGKSDNFALPKVEPLAEFMEDHFKKSGIDPASISYIETAANGNGLGDGIEFNAIVKTFDKYNHDKNNWIIGSVKANIGHAEAASTITQLTKIALQLHHKQIVPSLFSSPINHEINLDHSHFVIKTKNEEWNRRKISMGEKTIELPRRAVVHSFGAGGSNVHVIMEEYDQPELQKNTPKFFNDELVIFSAKNQERLKELASLMIQYLKEHRDVSLSDFAYTLRNCREEMETRLSLIVRSKEELIEGLNSYMEKGVNQHPVSTSINIFYKMPKESHRSILESSKDTDKIEMAKFWASGGEVNWEFFDKNKQANKLRLPNYPFEKRICWLPKKEEITKPIAHDNIEKAIVDIFCATVGIKPNELDYFAPLWSYGIDSILSLQIFQRVQSQINSKIDLASLNQCKTFQELVLFICNTGKDEPSLEKNESSSKYQKSFPQFPELIRLNTSEDSNPVFWLHAGLGGVEFYQDLAQKSKRAFFGIQARGFMTEREPLKGVQAMASYYVHIIQSVQPKGPYDIGGYSFGGALAYEVTRQLQELGENVNSIVMCDTHDSIHMKKVNTTYKSELLQTINTMLSAMKSHEPEKIIETLVHRDEIDFNFSDDVFLEKLVELANNRGLNKTASQLQLMTKQNAKVQKAYDIHNFQLIPLLKPHTVACYYFRNKSGSFWGPLEPYNIFTKKETELENVAYWGDWERQIMDFHMIDVDSSSHLTLLAEPLPKEAIFNLCELLYGSNQPSSESIDLLKDDILKKNGMREKLMLV